MTRQSEKCGAELEKVRTAEDGGAAWAYHALGLSLGPHAFMRCVMNENRWVGLHRNRR